MRRRAVLLMFLSLSVLAASSCRSRRQVPPPQTAPPVETATTPEPAVPVQSPDRDFEPQPASPEDVLSEDIMEANRAARERGWIRDAFFAFDASTLDAGAQEALQQ